VVSLQEDLDDLEPSDRWLAHETRAAAKA